MRKRERERERERDRAKSPVAGRRRERKKSVRKPLAPSSLSRLSRLITLTAISFVPKGRKQKNKKRFLVAIVLACERARWKTGERATTRLTNVVTVQPGLPPAAWRISDVEGDVRPIAFRRFSAAAIWDDFCDVKSEKERMLVFRFTLIRSFQSTQSLHTSLCPKFQQVIQRLQLRSIVPYTQEYCKTKASKEKKINCDQSNPVISKLLLPFYHH